MSINNNSSNDKQLRKRRQKDTTTINDVSDEGFMDIQDQDELIRTIHDQYIHQQDNILSIYTILCRYVVSIVSLLLTILLQYRLFVNSNRNSSTNRNNKLISTTTTLRWIHCLLAIFIDWYIPQQMIQPIIDSNNREKKQNVVGSSTIPPTSTNITSLGHTIYLPMFISIITASIAIWIERKSNHVPDVDNSSISSSTECIYLHYTLLISNVVLLLVSYVLQYDHNQYVTSIQKLHQSKYQYKEL